MKAVAILLCIVWLVVIFLIQYFPSFVGVVYGFAALGLFAWLVDLFDFERALAFLLTAIAASIAAPYMV